MIYSDSHFTLIHTVCGHFPVVFVMLCYGGDMRALMLVAHDLGMLNGDYAFLTVNLLPSAAIGNNTFMGNDGRDAEAALAFRGILSIYVREPTTELWRSFKEDVKDKMNAPPFQIQLDASEQVIHYRLTTPSCTYIKHILFPLMRVLDNRTTLTLPIGHCRVAQSLCLKARLTATPLI